MSTLLSRIAQKLYRTSEETGALTGTPSVHAKAMIFGGGTLFLLVSFGIAISQTLLEWTRNQAEVPVPLTQWGVLYETSATPCPQNSPAGNVPGCLANPDNPRLWTKAESRANHEQHRDRTVVHGVHEYWLGTTLSAAQLRVARARGANFMVVGLLRGVYDVWLDGDYYFSGSWTDYEPLTFPLLASRMALDRPLRLAIRMYPNAQVQPPPDLLTAYPGGPGLTTKAKATAFRRYLIFWSMARPLVLLLINWMLAAIFFTLWLSARERQEYFYISAYSLTYAFIQLRSLDLFYMSVSREFACAFELLNSMYFAIFGMLMGLAYARVRRSFFTIAVPLAVGVPILAAALVRNTLVQQRLSNDFQGWIGGTFAVIGALACGLQALHLRNQKNPGENLKLRTRRLVAFAGGMFGMAVLCFINAKGALPTLLGVFFTKSSPFYLLVYLGIVALNDYQKDRLLVQKTPVSEYHRRPVLPERLTGAILMLDLKNSEWLFRLGAQADRAGEYMSTCMSHLWGAVLAEKGLVLQTEGDALLAFFDGERAGDSDGTLRPVLEALRAVERISSQLLALERQFRDQGLISGQTQPFSFRAAVVVGQVRPFWREVGGTRFASWQEAGQTNPFVDSARLMDLERQLSEGGTARNIAIFPAELAAAVLAAQPATAAHWLFTSRELVGKHGTSFRVAAYLPGALPAAPSLTLIAAA